MKRSIDGDNHIRLKAPRRQDPVSCKFCRLKKLKCDRVSPCSNCHARKISCVYTSPNGLGQGGQKLRENSSETTLSAESAPISNTNHLNTSDLDARLRRLEHLASSFSASNPPDQPNISGFETVKSRPQVIASNRYTEPSSYSIGSSLVPFTEARKRDQDALETADRLESAAINVPCVYSMVLKDDDTRYGTTSLSERFTSSILTAAHCPNFSSPETRLTCSQLLLILPSLELGMALFENYIQQASWVYHIHHIPTTRAHLEDCYARLHAGQTFDVGKVGLLATIFAAGVYFFNPLPSNLVSTDPRIPKCLQNFSRKDALHCAERWSQLAHHCLRQAHYLTNPTIETIQAVIVLSHFLLPNLGSSSTYTGLISTMVNSAHILNIHQLDSKKNIKQREEKLQRGEKIDMIELELKRRIWWHLASSDWILSFFSGPQSGTYVVQPNQFHVAYPLNIDDSSLTHDRAPTSLDLSQPTEMSYFIFRCKMACIFREIVDYAASADLEVEDIPYEQVLFFDKKCRDLLTDAPFWLQLDPKSRARSKQINAERPYTAIYRPLIHLGIHTRLGRLHRPYLIRGFRDPKYAYSRMMCLRSARTVIELEKQMQQEFGKRSSWPKLIWFIIHHVFVATVILGMDYCFNQDDLANEMRKQEIMDCCRVLESSKEESEIARKGVEQLKRVLREWGARVDGDTRPGERRASISRSRASSSPDSNLADKDHLNEEPDCPKNSSTTASSTTIEPQTTQTRMESNEMPNLNLTNSGDSFEEGGDAAGFVMDDNSFDWFSNFDFDAEVSAGADWGALFKDLETPGVFEDNL